LLGSRRGDQCGGVLAVDAAALVLLVDCDDVPACEEVEDVADFFSVLVDEGCAGFDYAGDVAVIGIYIAVEWLRLIFLVHDRMWWSGAKNSREERAEE
jgi:hypothetical protein